MQGSDLGGEIPSPPPSAVVVVVEDDTRFWHIRRTQYVHWREREKSFAFLAFPLSPLQLGSRHCQSGGFEQRNNQRGKKFQILLYYLNGQYQIFIGVPIYFTIKTFKATFYKNLHLRLHFGMHGNIPYFEVFLWFLFAKYIQSIDCQTTFSSHAKIASPPPTMMATHTL